jgi:hypothetical protein
MTITAAKATLGLAITNTIFVKGFAVGDRFLVFRCKDGFKNNANQYFYSQIAFKSLGRLSLLLPQQAELNRKLDRGLTNLGRKEL